jgi:uncharacterized protein (TIRG00374 family)
MKLRRLLLLAGLIGILLVVMANLGDLPKFVAALQHLHWYIIVLIIAVQLVSYYCNAHYYQIFFAISDYKVDLRRLFEASLAINFANQALPSGGVAGTTYLSEAVKPEVPAGMATLAQLGRYIFTFLSYIIVLLIGFLLLFLAGSSDLDKPSVRFVIILMLAVIAVGQVLLMVFSDRTRLEAFMKPILSFGNGFKRRILRRAGPLVNDETLDAFLEDFYSGYRLVISHKGRWPQLLGWSLAYNIAEVMTIYVVFVGLGLWVNPGVVITAYTLAIIASLAGFVTGGVGVYELSMIGAFTALGIPFATAFTVVLVYRVLSMIIFLPPGFYYYRRNLLRQSEDPPSSEELAT